MSDPDFSLLPAFLLRPRPRPKKPVPKAPPAKPTTRTFQVEGVEAPVELRGSNRARRLSLRVDAARGVVQVVAPAFVGEHEAARFVARHLEWVRRRLAAVPDRLPLVDGAVIPVLGVAHTLRHDPTRRGGAQVVRADDGRWEIRIGGAPEFLPRRAETFLKEEARRLLGERSRAKAAQLGARVASITVRDTRSRWGSCSEDGRLNFSWRLIFTPDAVFDYVVAHEVAHLKEMNHSARFWALCAQLVEDMEGPRAWLKAHGSRLHRYG